jgi:hypothetical protein
MCLYFSIFRHDIGKSEVGSKHVPNIIWSLFHYEYYFDL